MQAEEEKEGRKEKGKKTGYILWNKPLLVQNSFVDTLVSMMIMSRGSLWEDMRVR